MTSTHPAAILSQAHASAQPTDARDISFDSMPDLKRKAEAWVREQVAFAWGEFVENGATPAQAAATTVAWLQRKVMQASASPSFSSDPVSNLRDQVINAAFAQLAMNQSFDDVAMALHELAKEA